ncbi:hypothetical protein AWB71_00918 [Caballeronia peredens]|nr:hypothetical protein AWB71_00918 [Caballeronia peredens]
MSFPEWGYSFNALYVPLTGGWHCALLPARELAKVDRGWRLTYGERKQKKKERQDRIERDRQDFDRLFRLRTDVRGARACSEFREYVAFIERHLRASSWDLLDGEGVTRALRDAVRDGHIIPVIARNWHGEQRVFRRYAPQHWPPEGGASFAARLGESNASVGRFSGQFAAAMHAADTVMNSRLTGSSRAFSSARASGSSVVGFDWLGAVEAASGAVAAVALVGATDGSGGHSMLKRFGDLNGSSSLLGDAQPFEYVPDELGGDAFELAASTNNPGYAAQMLGYDRKTFGKMIHSMKDEHDLGGADNVIWHDDGSVYFRDIWIDNMHNYAP